MSVYVDGGRNPFRRMVMCHMIADTLDELHAMARNIGLWPEWFQADASTPHYDLSKAKRALAVSLGAIEVDRRRLVEIIRRLRAERAGKREDAVDRHVTAPVDRNAGRCLATMPPEHVQRCGLPEGHEDMHEHTILIPTGSPWSGIVPSPSRRRGDR